VKEKENEMFADLKARLCGYKNATTGSRHNLRRAEKKERRTHRLHESEAGKITEKGERLTVEKVGGEVLPGHKREQSGECTLKKFGVKKIEGPKTLGEREGGGAVHSIP